MDYIEYTTGDNASTTLRKANAGYIKDTPKGTGDKCRTWAGYMGDVGLPRMDHSANPALPYSRVREWDHRNGWRNRAPRRSGPRRLAHRHVPRASGHDVAVRQRFPNLVAVDTITTVVIEDHRWRPRETA
jgi:hypothetical protein